MQKHDTNNRAGMSADALALQALAWTLSEEDRAQRLLALTGLTADHMRASIDDPTMLAAVIKFLEAFEPDLIACAEAIQCAPEELVTARRELER